MYLTLSAIVVGSLAQTNPASTPVALDSLCTGLDNSYVCAQTIEAHQLASADMARVATRTTAGLHLRLANGTTLTLKNTGHADDGSVVRFSFRDYLKGIGCFLLHRQEYEGAGYLLIHARSRKQFPLHSLPVISPDRSRIATASAGLSGGYGANAVQIWKVLPDGIQLEFEISPDDWEPADLSWLDNRAIRLRKQAPLIGDARAFSITVLLRRAETWTIHPND